MSSIFTLDNIEDFSEKLNIDELYEKKRHHDLMKLELFNKMLNNVHKRIKLTSRQKIDNQMCWYLVPETILGVPKYDQGACIAFLMDKLKNNGFNVRYIHPNLLFISWMHWVPGYIRSEFKKKTGIAINEYGQKVEEKDEDGNFKMIEDNPSDPNDYLLKQNDPNQKGKPQKKEYTPIKSYKPSGNLVYDDDVLNKIEGKFT
jgi:hypothetical protein